MHPYTRSPGGAFIEVDCIHAAQIKFSNAEIIYGILAAQMPYNFGIWAASIPLTVGFCRQICLLIYYNFISDLTLSKIKIFKKIFF
jgi:hypothetical protein